MKRIDRMFAERAHSTHESSQGFGMRARARGKLRVVATLLALTGCGREPPSAPVSPALTDQQAIEAATATERKYQAALAKGDLAFLGECAAGSPEAMRLVDMAADDSQGYSLAIVADARGAVAIWQGLQRLGPKKYQAYGPKGMRLDVNGWRQLRQLLVEAPFFSGEGPIDDSMRPPSRAFLVSCLDGERRVSAPRMSPTSFDQFAVRMRRLSGNYYSPPAAIPTEP